VVSWPLRGISGVSASVSVGNGFGGEWETEVGEMSIESSVMMMVGINIGT
jgi:hypothetical protein